MPDEYNLAPSKDTYRSLQSDVSPISAIKELVDNALDNWRREGHQENSVIIDINIDLENDFLRIEDTSGGIEEENIPEIFALGESSVSSVSQPIGAYGMGAKKAIVRLGHQATIKSRAYGADSGYGFTVGAEWLNSDGWTVSSQTFPEMNEGMTVIEIEGLRLEFDEITEEENASQYNDVDEFISALFTDLGETYEMFLSGNVGPEGSDVSIVINGDTVEPLGQFSCSHTPYDRFHPREFNNKKLDVRGRDDDVYIDLKAGILEEGGQEDAGTDIYIQNRKVISRSTEEDGGWTPDYLGNYQPALGRSRFQIRIYTDGGTDTLPWDTQKSSIDPYDPIMREAFNFLKRAGGRFVVTYEKFPGTFTQSYPKSSDHAVAEEQYDYSDLVQVQHSEGHTPDEDRPQASEVMDAVDAHLQTYRIKAPYLVADKLRPGYESRYSQQNEQEYPVWEIPESAQSLRETTLYVWLNEIEERARKDAESGQGIHFDDESPWWKTYYNQCLQRYTDEESIERIQDPPNLETNVESRLSSDSLPKSFLDAARREPPEGTESDDIVEDIESEQSETEDDGGDEIEESQDKDISENEADTGSSTDGESVDSQASTGEPKTEAAAADPVTGELGVSGSDSASDTQKSDKELIVMRPSSEVYNLLCEKLDLPQDAEPRVVGDHLLYAIIEILDSQELEEVAGRDT